jgi:hypothetical protein
MMLVIVITLGVGGGKTTRTCTASMMTKQEDAAHIIQAPLPTVADVAIISAVANADVLVKDDLVFAFGTITTSLYVVSTPGWAVPLQPPPIFAILLLSLLFSLQWPPPPLLLLTSSSSQSTLPPAAQSPCFIQPHPSISLCHPPPVHPHLLLTDILFFPSSPLEGYLPANQPFFCYLCVGNIIYHKNLKGLISPYKKMS